MRKIRESEATDIPDIVNYFINSDPKSLRKMGVDPNKLIPRDEWLQLLSEELKISYDMKRFFYLMWQLEGNTIGHSNIGNLTVGEEGLIHLHIWDQSKRLNGNGTFFIRKCISRYFEIFDLKRIICEPYALNPGPNKTLPKAGFEFVEQYETIPGIIGFHQPVNRWVLTREKWLEN